MPEKMNVKGFFSIKDGEIEGIASTETVDRHGDSVVAEGWDLKEFKKNPSFLLFHDQNKFPIGRVEKLKVVDNKLVFKALFTDITQEAREAYELVKGGFLNAFSVGFIPGEVEYDEKKGAYTIGKSKLLEISLVNTPANPDALVTAKGLESNELAKSIAKDITTEDTPEVTEDVSKSENGEEDDAASHKKTLQKIAKTLQSEKARSIAHKQAVKMIQDALSEMKGDKS